MSVSYELEKVVDELDKILVDVKTGAVDRIGPDARYAASVVFSDDGGININLTPVRSEDQPEDQSEDQPNQSEPAKKLPPAGSMEA